jgi:serine/threonine protein kinase/tetratricopeptide (TPR) repeat protein
MADISAEEWRVLSECLDQALDLDESAREEWLAELRSKDPGMADRVTQAIAAREQPGFSMFMSSASVLPNEETASLTLIGRRVGAYEIEAEIGRGGMGSVWRARRADGRYQGTVAIKFVHAAWIGRTGEHRFQIEGNVLSRLDHPHIARLLNAGILESAQPYLVLEYVEGESIDAYCAKHQLGVEARVRLFIDVLAAVAHAHAQLIVHRDIKPANVFVTHEGVVKLLDFGIAKLLDDGADPSAMTRSGAALTPQYAAPEQLLGQPISTATDVYALGLLLYVLLSGSHPVPSGSGSSAELINAIVTIVPAQASSVATIETVSRESLEGDLDNILHKALKKEPNERYASSAAFADDLQRFLTHQPVRARADTLRYRTQKFVRRHRGGVTAALLSTIAIIAGFIGTAWQAHRAQENALQAEQARGHALEQLRFAEASNEFLSSMLEQGSDKPFTTPELLARGEGIVNGQFKDEPALHARLLLTLADLYAQVQERSKARALFLAAQADARTVRDDGLNLEIDCALAMEDADQNAFDKAVASLNFAIRRAERTPDLDRGILAACLDARGQAFRLAGNLTAAKSDAIAALATLGVARPGQRTLELSARTSLAEAESDLGDHAEAVQEYDRAMLELAQMGRGETAFAVGLLNEQGIALAKSGQWLRAAAVYERGLSIERRVAGGGEVSPVTEINFAKLLAEFGREREALSLFDSAVIAARNRGDTKAILMVDLLSAPALCQLGQLDECEARLRRSGEGMHRKYPPGHATFGTYDTELAQLAIARGKLQEARQHLHDALIIFEKVHDRNPNELRAMALLTEVDLGLGDTLAASADAAAVVEKARAALSGFPGSAWMGRALQVQGEVLRAQGQTEAAKTTLRKALDMLTQSAGKNAPWTQQTQAALASL